MPLTKAQKTKIIEELKDKINRQKAIAFGDISGVKVADLTKLRHAMRNEGGEVKVAKKTLITRVLREHNIDANLKKMDGEIALGIGYQDEIAPFRTFYGFAKTNENLKLLGGIIGKEIFDREKALTLAQLPSRQELLAKMVGSISSPLSGMVNVLHGNLRNLIYALSAIQKVKS
ncbi:MAG: 50S ribosomal protein L10 [Candidatus Nealsonbacteria bacterium]|nr:50S ribosomal protein L10 [Candidatus Nealsonbacteria bacterium]